MTASSVQHEPDSVLLQHVSWESYERLIESLGDRRIYHTYVDGDLEIMSPSEEHEWIKEFAGRLIETAALELNVPIKSVGSTTRWRREKMRGLEPDQSYYVQHESAVRGRRESAAETSLPPDLVVEVEITRKVRDRLEAYAALQVPEVWRYRREGLEFFTLGPHGYEPRENSAAFPLLTSEIVFGYLARLATDDENSILRDFIRWLRQRSAGEGGESTERNA